LQCGHVGRECADNIDGFIKPADRETTNSKVNLEYCFFQFLISLRHHFYTKPKHRRFSRTGSTIKREEKTENGGPENIFTESIKKMNENFIKNYNNSSKQKHKKSSL